MITKTTEYQALSDSHLFILMKQDDGKAFEELYNRYWSYLIDSAYRPLQSRQKAEDIVQEIFISMYLRRKTIDLQVSIKAYLNKALKFKVLNEFRSMLVRSSYQKSYHFTNTAINHNTPEIEVKELNETIERSIYNLPEKCKKSFLLSRKENLSYKEISEELTISVSTVEKHIIQALKTIRLTVTSEHNW